MTARVKGQYWKSGELWLIEVPELDVMTQGYTEQEALEMIVDAIEELVNVEGFGIVLTQSEEQKAEHTFSMEVIIPEMRPVFVKWREERKKNGRS